MIGPTILATFQLHLLPFLNLRESQNSSHKMRRREYMTLYAYSAKFEFEWPIFRLFFNIKQDDSFIQSQICKCVIWFYCQEFPSCYHHHLDLIIWLSTHIQLHLNSNNHFSAYSSTLNWTIVSSKVKFGSINKVNIHAKI